MWMSVREIIEWRNERKKSDAVNNKIIKYKQSICEIQLYPDDFLL